MKSTLVPGLTHTQRFNAGLAEKTGPYSPFWRIRQINRSIRSWP